MPPADQRKDEWVGRVLGVTLARTAPRGAVDYAKLLLRWRSAQQRAVESLDAFGPSFLALDEVKDDPRYALVERATGTLSRLVPAFGDTLADNLDAAMSAGPGEASGPHLRAAIGTIGQYRQQLAGVPALVALASFAKRAVGLDVDAVAILDEALGSIEREVSTRLTASPA